MKTAPARVTLVLTAGIVVSAGAFRLTDVVLSFDEFITQYKRSYLPGSTEYAERKVLYLQRASAAKAKNQRTSRRWTARANSLWDRTADELISQLGWQPRQVQNALRLQGSDSAKIAIHSFKAKQSTTQPPWHVPDSKNWAGLRTWDNVVQEQGSCGSCWAIAATTLLQAHEEIRTGNSRKLSVQELVSCVPNPKQCGGTGGCGHNGTRSAMGA